jgi:hypothetical protein
MILPRQDFLFVKNSLLQNLKGQSNEIFYLRFFSQMDFSQAPYSVFKDFLNLASNSRR